MYAKNGVTTGIINIGLKKDFVFEFDTGMEFINSISAPSS
jgi:hypothetical protein